MSPRREHRVESHANVPPDVGGDGFLPLRIVSRRYHFHLPGVVYVITTLIIVVGAVNGQNNLLFWLFGLAVGGLVVSGIVSGASLMGVRLERCVPPRSRVGEPCEIRYRVTNRNRFFPAFALSIEEVGVPFRKHERPTWPAHLAAVAAFCPGVRARESRITRCVLTPATRGRCTFSAVRVSSTFPFGITRKSVVFAESQRTLVWPRASNRDLPPVRGGNLGSENAASSVRAGAGEFLALREYIPGDPLRAVAWRPSSRLGRPIVREYSRQTSKRLWLCCDLPPGLHDAHAEEVVSTAAGLAESASRAGIIHGLLNGRGDALVPLGIGPRHERELLDALALLEPDTSKADAPHELQQPVLIVGPQGGTPHGGQRVEVPKPVGRAHAAPPMGPVARTRVVLQRLWDEWLSPAAGTAQDTSTPRREKP